MTSPSGRTSRLAMDGLLSLMVLIWAGNYSLVKVVFREIPPLTFNAVRLILSSVVFLAVIYWSHARALRGTGQGWIAARVGPVLRTEAKLTGRDWLHIAGLALVGHFLYQMAFISALGLTTVANSALISGLTPVAIALLTAAVGHERVGRWHWAGLALSIAGLYFVSGHGARLSGESLRGDVLMLGGVVCWACYTVFSRPLLSRHSPLAVTGLSMALGTAMFVPFMIPTLVRFDWSGVSPWAWVAILASAVFALNVAYLIWYTSVQRIGSARTSVFSNMVPAMAMLIAWLALGERLDAAKLAGAAAIVGGVVLTRVASRGRPASLADPPAEE